MPCKICYLTPSVRMLGARQSLFQLVTNLDRSRFEPIVVCPREGDLEASLRVAGIQTFISPMPPWRKGKSMIVRPLNLNKLNRIIRDEGVDLIHCNEFHSNPYAVSVAKKLNLPVVTHHRLSITERQIKNYFLEKADRVIVVSGAAGKDFVGWKNVDQKVSVVYNGLNYQEFCSDVDSSEFREGLGISDDAFVLAQVGLLSRRKQQHVAIKAFSILCERFPKLHLAIVGSRTPSEKDYEEQILRQAADSAGRERIHFVPFQQNIANVFAGIDLNLLISDDEGFGRVILEAGAFGKPSIGSRVGGIPEVIAEGETGLLIDQGDSQGLAKAIAELIENREKYDSFSRAALEAVKRKFSIEAHVNQVQKIYEELLA